jgi:dCMP deaminase
MGIVDKKISSWDDYFMTMVYLVASRSKDNRTHIGAVIVGPNNEVRSTGYNSFPRGINDDILQRQEKPGKYDWFAHAEVNAIYNAAMVGTPMKGCRIYTNGIPCTSCAFGIINSGISEVIVDKFWDDSNYDVWLKKAEITRKMFNEANICLRFWEGDFIEIYRFRAGEKI